MTSIACPVLGCDRPRPGNAQICGACAGQLARALGDVPSLAAQLDITLSRQTAHTAGGSGNVTPLPYDLRASLAGRHLWEVLVRWVRLLLDGVTRPEGPRCETCEHWTCGLIAYSIAPSDTLPEMARWLQARYTRIVAHALANEAAHDISAAVQAVEGAVDRPPDRWYAGICAGLVTGIGRCPVDLYVKPGAATVVCPGCGQVWNVSERRAWLLSTAEDVLGYGAMIAHALTSLGAEVTPERIRKWAERGRLVGRGTDLRGRPQYRVGDVMDLLATQRERTP